MSPYKKIRRDAGMSQEELAQRMLLPVYLIQQYERQNKQPSLHFKANFRGIFCVTDQDIEEVRSKCQ